MRTRVPALLLTLLVVASPLATALPGDGPAEERSDVRSPHLYGPLAVVAPGDWRDVIQPLMDWRNWTSRYLTRFVPYEEAIAQGVGHDNPARLKDWLLDRFPDSDGPEALLLVGDADVIPVRRVFTDILQDGNTSDPLNFRWTDDYYLYGAEVDWDRDGDHVYGEDGEVLDEIAGAFARRGDWERLVGRIPASTALELERFVDKLLAYERDPEPGDWYTSALLVSGLMDVPNHLDNPYTPDLDGGYELFSDNSYESHSRLVDMLPERYETTWLWDYPFLEGGHWNRSVDTLDHASVVRAFDQGHSIVAMNGHGWTDGSGLAHYNGSGYSTYWWDWSNAYDYSDADNASNDGRLPWAYVAACYVGDVTLPGDRTLERLVMNPEGGAIGLVAGNGENYKGESMSNASFGNWFLERSFWRNYFEFGPGEAMHWTKAAYLDLVSSDAVPHTDLYDAYYIADYLSHNLLGDPLTRTWTDRPADLRVSPVQLIEDETRPGTYDYYVRVTDEHGDPVEGAVVNGGRAMQKGETDEDGWALMLLYNDYDANIVVSARNFRVLEVAYKAPLIPVDIEVADLMWSNASLGPGEDPLPGQGLNLSATVRTSGPYPYDQARVRFSVAPEGGDWERLVPDVFVRVETGTLVEVGWEWTPPGPGRWRVRAEVDPNGDLPNVREDNDVVEVGLTVRGPPEWRGLPASVDIDCSKAPGGSVDLSPYVWDPDTPVGELELGAEVTGWELPWEPRVHVDGEGVLRVCSNLTRASIGLELWATDGTFTATAPFTVNITGEVGRLRLVAPGPTTFRMGVVASGKVTIEDLGSGVTEELLIKALDVYPALHIEYDGRYTFVPQHPGTFHLRLGVTRLDGTTEPTWEGAMLVFHVLPANTWPPQLVGLTDLRLAEGEVARVGLQALDLEGGTVSFEVVDDGDIGATVDEGSGLLTLRPSEGDAGLHRVVVRLSDGELSEDVTISVVVEPEEASAAPLATLVIVIVVALVLFLWWRRRTASARVEDPNGNESGSE